MASENILRAAKTRLDEQHDDTCKMWGLFGAGCDCGASHRQTDRIVREVSEDFRRLIRQLDQGSGK